MTVETECKWADVVVESEHSLPNLQPAPTSPCFNNNENLLNGSGSSASSTNGVGSSSASAVHSLLQGGVNKPPADVDYLTQLLKDKKQLAAFPNVFQHIERLLDDEINRVRVTIFQCEFTNEPLSLPEPQGEVVTQTEKVFVPVKEHPDYNFVGRILGPRGMTAKQLEAETGCKIMVRGKGSMRDKKKEEMNRGKPNWEHLNEELHVLIQCDDTPNRCEIKLRRAIDEVSKLLIPSPEGEDELKKKQLMELAIINGTYRNAQNQNGQLQLAAAVAAAAGTNSTASALRGSPALSAASRIIGNPLIMQQQQQRNAEAAAGMPGANNAALIAALQAQQLQQLAPASAGYPANLLQLNGAADYQQLLLSQMQYDPTQLALLQQQQLLMQANPLAALGEYKYDVGQHGSLLAAAGGGAAAVQRRFLGQHRAEPYITSAHNNKRD
ncbi:KH domain-containing protein [Aphelenchoides fujianensis]|nr:KH domain-containing protein [Aphelenchoides fujianensis]